MKENYKDLLVKRFKKSLNTYDANAIVQEEMASELIAKLVSTVGYNFETIIEIGSGSGLLTKKILKNLVFSTIYVNDIVDESERYVKSISEDISFFGGDAQKVMFPQKADLIISNASFQWMSDFPEFTKKLSSSLNDNGVLAFTSFGVDNLCEVSKITNLSLNYLNDAEINDILKDYFEIIHCSSKLVSLEFDDVMSILKHLKHSGVNSLTDKAWTRSTLQDFETKYKNLFKKNSKLSLTYNPNLFILNKLSKK